MVWLLQPIFQASKLTDNKAWCLSKSGGRDRFIKRCHTFAKFMLLTAWWEHALTNINTIAIHYFKSIILHKRRLEINQPLSIHTIHYKSFKYIHITKIKNTKV